MDYVIARKWPSGNLCAYAYGSQVFHSETIADMEAMKEFINGKNPGESYEIYLISPEPFNRSLTPSLI